jgi:hypothetical protein
MHTIIVCDWIPPAFGAVGQYMELRARQRAAAGGRATLIGLGVEAATEVEPDLTILRLAAPPVDKQASMLKRGLWALETSLRLLRATHRAIRGEPREECEIVVTGSPPFLAYLFIVFNRLVWRQTLVYRITDFYPETLFAAGHLPWLRPVAGLFHGLRRGATRIEALGEDQRRRLAEGGVPADRVVVVRDVSPILDWSRRTPVNRPFPPDKAILLYSGNLGVAHDIDTLCQAYERHVRHGSNRVRLWLNGVGGRVESLRAFCAERDLPLHFSAPAALEDLPEVLRAGDGHLVLLRTPFWGYVLPSKIYACLELPQPVFYVGPKDSDVHLLSKDRPGRYFQTDPGDIDGCAAALEAFADHVLPGRD